jgi:hypothetical protein
MTCRKADRAAAEMLLVDSFREKQIELRRKEEEARASARAAQEAERIRRNEEARRAEAAVLEALKELKNLQNDASNK